MKDLFFSIVIPLYNKEVSICRALSSIQSQKYTNFEVVLVNDGSTDNSLNRAKIFLSKSVFPYKIINKKNGGVSSARNEGIRYANYEYIAFLDADDTWDENFLSIIANLITKTPDASLWGGRQRIFYNNSFSKLSSISYLPENFNGYVDNYFSIATKGIIYHSSSIVINKSRIVEKGIYFDECLVKGEDLDFYFRNALSFPVAFTASVISSYHLDSENRAMNRRCSLKKRLIGNLNKYSPYRMERKDFSKFLSAYALSCVALLLNEGYAFEDIKYIKKYIIPSELTIIKRIFYYLPVHLKKIFYAIRIK